MPHQKFSHEQLEDAFNQVKTITHWKDPINSTCRVEDKDIISQAIRYFTGTEAEFGEPLFGVVRVKAIGYRQGPCGDH
jgi:hypothetical protein